ncbi:MAG TPA: LamG-like jellyroll fold domain-containing protein [Pirellulales bacterium]|nr:LamG-like jellyroll fold domain-containing protein [Pirellulales bacterium]
MNPVLAALSRHAGFFRAMRRGQLLSRTTNHRPRQRTRLRLEVLEERSLLTAVALPADAVSWWTANNTASDALGLNNATLSNVTYATGEVGKAFSFNGSNGWAALGDPSSLAFTSSFTIEGWVDVKGLPTNYNFGSIMFRGDDRPGLDPYVLSIQPNGDLLFQISSTTAGAMVEAPVPMGQLVHVAATLDDGTGLMTLYENGAVVAQNTTTIRPFGALDPTQEPGVGIGNSNALDNYDVPFNGLIDELTVYNRALTSSEVLGIDKAGSSGKIISPIAVTGSSVVDGSGPATFTITRANTSGSLTVNWTTANDTAVAGTDYVAASGTVTFADGQAAQTVPVTTLNDTAPEPNEDFELVATPSGGTSVMGLATILTNTTSISVSNDTATEGGTAIRSLGAFIPAGLGGLTDAYAIIDGPDGNVYVSTLTGSAVYRYDAAGNPLPAPGQSGATFVAPGSGGLSTARDIAFGPDGYLYVVSQATNAVLRYNPVYGTPAGLSGLPGDAVFIPSGSGGLNAPRGLTFHTDALGHSYVYVTSADGTVASSVMRFDAATGAPAGVSGSPGDAIFIANGSGGLNNPSRIVFGPDGNAYVSSTASNAVLRYDPDTGAPAGVSGNAGDAVFVTPGSGGLDGPIAMVFRPDGYIYVVGWRSNSVLRYQASNGAYVSTVVPSGSGGVISPIDLMFDATGNLLVTSRGTDQVLRYGATSQFAFTVSLAWPSVGTTTVSYGTADGTAVSTGTSPNYAATSGTLTFPPGLTSQTVVVQTLDDGQPDPTRYFTLNLSNPVGGVITSGHGIGTILDDTKFYVADGGNDQTYQYASTGAARGNNALDNGDTAPRGVATTSAGATEWVVDANKNVYVYSTGGALLGSWSAGGLSSSAMLTGIATNGTDLWLVDSSTAKVYKFTGAAGRLSGSQSADSSFNLAGGKNGNSNPQDMVTDGTSIWVIDGTKHKVFKYTVSGSSLGNWSIDPANTHPTGITIDPTNVSDIWIVDNGTLKVYQYTGATSRTSGSQNASATFALAAGDTNPQGIADPPVGAASSVPTPVSPGPTTVTSVPIPVSKTLPSNPDTSVFHAYALQGAMASADTPVQIGQIVAPSSNTASGYGTSATHDQAFAAWDDVLIGGKLKRWS